MTATCERCAKPAAGLLKGHPLCQGHVLEAQEEWIRRENEAHAAELSG